jgi:hypothetical protein
MNHAADPWCRDLQAALWFFQGLGGDSQRRTLCSNSSPARQSQQLQSEIATLKKTDVLTYLCRLRLAVSFLMPSQTQNCFIEYQVTSLVDFLTVHHNPHILDKTVYNLERLRCGYPSLILCESIQPLEYRFDVILSKKLLNKFFCVALPVS